MNDQCKFCIHNSVCAYKEQYENAVKLYEKSREEYEKYPWIKFSIECRVCSVSREEITLTY